MGLGIEPVPYPDASESNGWLRQTASALKEPPRSPQAARKPSPQRVVVPHSPAMLPQPALAERMPSPQCAVLSSGRQPGDVTAPDLPLKMDTNWGASSIFRLAMPRPVEVPRSPSAVCVPSRNERSIPQAGEHSTHSEWIPAIIPESESVTTSVTTTSAVAETPRSRRRIRFRLDIDASAEDAELSDWALQADIELLAVQCLSAWYEQLPALRQARRLKEAIARIRTFRRRHLMHVCFRSWYKLTTATEHKAPGTPVSPQRHLVSTSNGSSPVRFSGAWYAPQEVAQAFNGRVPHSATPETLVLCKAAEPARAPSPLPTRAPSPLPARAPSPLCAATGLQDDPKDLDVVGEVDRLQARVRHLEYECHAKDEHIRRLQGALHAMMGSDSSPHYLSSTSGFF
jgi:hypothetical protein